MKFGIIVTGAVATGLLATAVFAHSGATGIVKERMDEMSVMGEAMKALAPIMRGEVAYDAEVVRQGGEAIGAHAGEQMTIKFPEGSGGKPSEAKDTVWSDWEEFAALAEQLQIYSEGLALAADNGLMMTGTGTADTGEMMGSSAMMGASDTMIGGGTSVAAAIGLRELSEMSADGVFTLLSQTCSACHTKFREEAK